MIIDFHTHAFPGELAKRALPLLAQRSGLKPFSDGTAKGALLRAKSDGVDKIVVCPIATKPSQQTAINNWAAQINNGAIIALGSVHPFAEDVLDELERIKALGLKGIKLHPDYQDFFVDDERLVNFYKKIAELKFIVVFHAGVDIGLDAPYKCPPDRLKNALPLLEGAQVIAAHMGGYEMWDKVEAHLCGQKLYFDISFTPGHIPLSQAERIIKMHGADKILLGSDLPWDYPARHIEYIKGLPISEIEKEMILGGNAVRLLGL